MTNKIEELINKRTEFLTLLDQDIGRNEKIREEIEKDLKLLEETRQNIQQLGTQPEHTALIPLSIKLYMPGKIIHTGEYIVKKKAHPNSYRVLKTLDQTFNDLDQRIKCQQKLLEKADLAIPQLVDRKKLLLGQTNESSLNTQPFVHGEEYGISSEVTSSMPQEIRSNKGVAVKVGGFYEILEYED